MTEIKNLILENEALNEENKLLRAEHEVLKKEIESLNRRITQLRFSRGQLNRSRNQLLLELEDIKKMSMFEFADKYCNDAQLEEAGHQLARSLGVGK